MADQIRVQLMDSFVLYVNGEKIDGLMGKSRKGVSFVAYLILNNGQSVPNYKLLSTLWSEEQSTNPENALKTLVSRMRSMMNQIYPDMGNCIVADRGSYHWESMPGMTVDVYEIEEIMDRLYTMKDDDAERRKLFEKLLELYPGNLLTENDQAEWVMSRSALLHNKYLSSIYAYIDLLKANEEYEEIAAVCHKALDVDNFDDRLHMELMTALINVKRTSDALMQYKHVMNLNYRYLGVTPSADMQEFYKRIVHAGKTLDFSLEAIRNELKESSNERGAFVCEYVVFKEIYNLQMRNLERLGSTMFLGIVMISNLEGEAMDPIKQDTIMNSLLEILRTNLRKGDTITQFSPSIFALLLPTVNYMTGNMVMERIKRIFYRKYPNTTITYRYRVGPLSSS